MLTSLTKINQFIYFKFKQILGCYRGHVSDDVMSVFAQCLNINSKGSSQSRTSRSKICFSPFLAVSFFKKKIISVQLVIVPFNMLLSICCIYKLYRMTLWKVLKISNLSVRRKNCCGFTKSIILSKLILYVQLMINNCITSSNFLINHRLTMFILIILFVVAFPNLWKGTLVSCCC